MFPCHQRPGLFVSSRRIAGHPSQTFSMPQTRRSSAPRYDATAESKGAVSTPKGHWRAGFCRRAGNHTLALLSQPVRDIPLRREDSGYRNLITASRCGRNDPKPPHAPALALLRHTYASIAARHYFLASAANAVTRRRKSHDCVQCHQQENFPGTVLQYLRSRKTVASLFLPTAHLETTSSLQDSQDSAGRKPDSAS